jgi:regulator of sigma E protease
MIPAWAPWVLPAFLLLITPIVFFHELGHFSVARLFGFRIETFSIGFGREIVGWTDRHGTRWKISWLPIGGYVKFFGDADAAGTPDREGLQRMTPAERSQAFQSRPLYQRALVVLAGPVANFVLAIAIFAVMYMTLGRPLLPPRIDLVQPNSAAAAAGLRAGDLVKAIDGTRIDSYEELSQIVMADGGRTIPIVVLRSGGEKTLSVTPRLTVAVDRFGNKVTIGRLGILSKGVITAVRYGPIGAVAAACDEVRIILESTFRARVQLFSGNTSMLSGPIGIAKLAGQVASESWLELIGFAALISVSVGLINLFPIPLLDGGHLLYYACEAVLGRPLGERAQEVGFRVGLAVVLSLMILATWNDVVRNFF